MFTRTFYLLKEMSMVRGKKFSPVTKISPVSVPGFSYQIFTETP